MWNWHKWEILPSSIWHYPGTFENSTMKNPIMRKASLDLSIADLMAILVLVTNTARGKGRTDVLRRILATTGEYRSWKKKISF